MQMTDGLRPGLRNIVATSVKGRTPYRAGERLGPVGSASQTATKSDSGSVASASAWIWPTLPQPIEGGPRRGSSARLTPGKYFATHPPQERERLGHLVHAVHAVFDADPAPVVVLGQDAEDGVVIVEPFAGDAVPQVRRIAERAVGLAQIVERRSLGR